jgi:hypothetical protein
MHELMLLPRKIQPHEAADQQKQGCKRCFKKEAAKKGDNKKKTGYEFKKQFALLDAGKKGVFEQRENAYYCRAHESAFG